ncbi:hypothetical protein LOC67_19245 [Stieleria sp. JC731]|uniref:hypothetical protein n=1 Tax=Pirellulaceae TaxID=2691357 RepID=UPI001E2F467B|nr:hypothetical protein [Stieleria sp. JC731]MCC9602692.1 hypothetical protein [Stieleria sp. JC731]
MTIPVALESLESDHRCDLDRHLHRIDIFKVGLVNSFGVNLRSVRRRVDSNDSSRRQPFHYLPEVIPFIQPRVTQLSAKQRVAFESIKEYAIESFWTLYASFLPLSHSISQNAGIDSEEIEPTLGRSIILFDVSRGTKFATYVDKSLRESVKNVRGRRFAESLQIPVSAGRLVHKLNWLLQQREFDLGRSLSIDESEQTVMDFLLAQPVRFHPTTMRRVAEAVRDGRPKLSLDRCLEWMEPSSNAAAESSFGHDGYVEHVDQCQYQLRQIHEAMQRASFSDEERAIVLGSLELPHDASRLRAVSRNCTSATLRKRSTRLLIRLMAARYAPQSPRFGWMINTTAVGALERLREQIEKIESARVSETAVSSLPEASKQSRLGAKYGEKFVEELLNWMSVSSSVYRISIAERGHIAQYLLDAQRLENSGPPDKPSLAGSSQSTETDRTSGGGHGLSSLAFSKLRAALIEQDRLGFPCCSE